MQGHFLCTVFESPPSLLPPVDRRQITVNYTMFDALATFHFTQELVDEGDHLTTPPHLDNNASTPGGSPVSFVAAGEVT